MLVPTKVFRFKPPLLQRASSDWMEAFGLAVDKGVVLLHPERGEQSTLDVARSNAHDVHHHEWDIRRSLD